MSGCAPPFLRSLNNKAKIKLKNTEQGNVSTESLPPGYFDQQLQNILVNISLKVIRNLIIIQLFSSFYWYFAGILLDIIE